MHNIIRIWVAAMAAMVFTSSAAADLLGLVVFREEVAGSGPAPSGPERWIYRVYAEFRNSADSVRSWGIGTSWGAGIWNIMADGSPGSGFTNIPDSVTSNNAPAFSGLFTDWDTYMTIGILYGNQGPGGANEAVVTQGTPLFIANGTNTWTGNGGIILDPPNSIQGRADYRVSGNDNEYRVLLMQLVVNAGEHVHGSIGISWRSAGGLISANTFEPFTSVPSAGGWLIFAALLARRRRRR